jgi:hypothetical protein
MKVYQTSYDGYFVGEVIADESPLEPGVFLIPRGCVTEEPPETGINQRARFVNGEWAVEDIPVAQPTPEPTTEELLARERASMSMTFAQMIIGLVTSGWLTEEEGEQWLDGVLPLNVTTIINSLPEKQRFVAKVRAKRPSVILRNDPLVVALSLSNNKTQEELDAFFRTFSEI